MGRVTVEACLKLDIRLLKRRGWRLGMSRRQLKQAVAVTEHMLR